MIDGASKCPVKEEKKAAAAEAKDAAPAEEKKEAAPAEAATPAEAAAIQFN
jgi:hypothetical protein